MLTLPFPALGATLGYEAGLEAPPPPKVSLIPLNGGVMAALSAQF